MLKGSFKLRNSPLKSSQLIQLRKLQLTTSSFNVIRVQNKTSVHSFKSLPPDWQRNPWFYQNFPKCPTTHYHPGCECFDNNLLEKAGTSSALGGDLRRTEGRERRCKDAGMTAWQPQTVKTFSPLSPHLGPPSAQTLQVGPHNVRK